MVLKGARQVGKTWLMKEFGQNYYNSFVYFNFDEKDDEIQECPEALNTLKYFKEKANDYQFKELLTENYCLQQLRGQFEIEPRYFSDKNHEIDFVLQYGAEIIPIGIKGGEDKFTPSFKRYIADHQPEYALRFSKRGYRKDGHITNLPLYLARKTRVLL